MGEVLEITYQYTFDSRVTKSFTITLDRSTLTLLPGTATDPPPWTALGFHRCECCAVDGGTTAHCPIAVNLAGVMSQFQEVFSYENVAVTVTTEERTYAKTTDIQRGLSAMIGIIMVTSGCPAMERLKPMVRFHLPFATLEETVYRMLSTYLVAQFLLLRKGRDVAPSLEDIERIYGEVAEVNRNFVERLRNNEERDATINALVNLDCFAALAPMAVEDMLVEMEPYFGGYF
jgi:hypothetical protein